MSTEQKHPARPSKPNYGSGYDPKRGDHFGERDAHGGYVPDRPVKTEGDPGQYDEAHGHGKQAERSNPKAGLPEKKVIPLVDQ